MSKRNSFILGLLFVILVVEIIVLAPREVGTPDAQQPPAASATATGGPESSGQVMKDVYSVEAKHDGKEWELWASKALRPKENQEWTIERVKVKFYAQNGVSYTVTGKQGQVMPNEKGIRDIQIRGNVVTRSSNGYVFKSETIFYDSLKKRLSSPSDVEMESPPDKDGGIMKLTGTDMLADMATNEITVAKNVNTQKRFKDGKTLHIKSDRAQFSGRTKMAQFFGNVVLTLDNMKVTGPEAKFAYDQKGENLESVLVGGGIKVTDADKYATSQSVNLNFKSGKVVFDGSPRVMQNGDELTGDEIVFLDGGHKVQVVNARAQIDEDSMNAGSGTSSDKSNVHMTEKRD